MCMYTVVSYLRMLWVYLLSSSMEETNSLIHIDEGILNNSYENYNSLVL